MLHTGKSNLQKRNWLWYVRVIQNRQFKNLQQESNMASEVFSLTLILLTWRKWWTPNNATKWQMEFNSAFKGLSNYINTIRGNKHFRYNWRQANSHTCNSVWIWYCDDSLRCQLHEINSNSTFPFFWCFPSHVFMIQQVSVILISCKSKIFCFA
jgi:hypothetical protein